MDNQQLAEHLANHQAEEAHEFGVNPCSEITFPSPSEAAAQSGTVASDSDSDNIAVKNPQYMQASQNNHSIFSNTGDMSGFDNALRIAQFLSGSTIVPPNFQGEKNLSNTLIALEIANRIGVSPIAVMQNIQIIHNKPSFSSVFIIAAVNTCGRFYPLRFQFFGTQYSDDFGCYAYTWEKTDAPKKDEDFLRGSPVTLGMAKREGWYGKNGSKWPSMPEQMLTYRAASFWSRAYAPDLTMGMLSQEEVQDIGNKR